MSALFGGGVKKTISLSLLVIPKRKKKAISVVVVALGL
jgi:hypothetical protein